MSKGIEFKEGGPSAGFIFWFAGVRFTVFRLFLGGGMSVSDGTGIPSVGDDTSSAAVALVAPDLRLGRDMLGGGGYPSRMLHSVFKC